MPNIKPISDLRNYTEVLKEVDVSNRVYLTRNGHGEYGILTMQEIDELDRLKAAYTLFSNLQKAEERAQKEGWIDAEDVEKMTPLILKNNAQKQEGWIWQKINTKNQRGATMCDVHKYSEMYKDMKNLQPEETLQLVMAAKDEEEKDFFEMLGNFLLQQKQKKVIEGNLF